MKITVSTNLDDVIEQLGVAASNIKKELKIAIWAATKKARSLTAKEIGKELNATQKVIKGGMDTKRINDLSAKVVLKKESRPSLNKFRARHIKAGVSAKVSRTKGGKTILGGFMGPNPKVKALKLNGHAFKRLGKERLPIVMLRGASPWGVFVKNNMSSAAANLSEDALRKEIEKRIRYNNLKRAGQLNWQQDNQTKE